MATAKKDTKQEAPKAAQKEQDAAKTASSDAPDVGQAEVQARVDEATEKGYIGESEVDETPNEHYTVGGVTAGKPTPETEKRS